MECFCWGRGWGEGLNDNIKEKDRRKAILYECYMYRKEMYSQTMNSLQHTSSLSSFNSRQSCG